MIWTEAEARAYLPRLRQLLRLVRRSAALASRARTNGHGSLGAGGSEGGEEDPAGDDLASLTPEEALAEIDERDIVLRDLERGLVDFPSRSPGGREVLLCWQSDEEDLAWWHFPDDGFAGRRPLPVPPDV